MVFSSPIFLFFFLPTLLVFYYCSPQRFKNLLLLLASLLFYAWGEGFYVILMLVSIALNYVFGRLIESQRDQLRYLITGVSLNLAILVSYKYSNFIVDNLNILLSGLGASELDLAPVHLPLGISFFTFQAISYLVDVKRGEIESQKNILNLGLYISLFPQLIAGPIVRYQTINNQITQRKVTSLNFLEGAERFILGLAKKMLIANPLGYAVDSIFAMPIETLPTHVLWFAILLYALQIYFDFSGYSDMAIGLGKMLGFRFLENFNYPYISKSLQEFWRRWHISLSTWFRDYLYIPLGGNRGSHVRTYLNLSCVFVLCGLWHGASWNFLIWGLFHGGVLSIERMGLGRLMKRTWTPVRHAYLLIVILTSWVFFRADTLQQSVEYLTMMYRFDFFSVPFEVLDILNIELFIALIAGLLLSTPVYRVLKEKMPAYDTSSLSIRALVSSTLRCLIAGTLLTLVMMQLAASTHNPFIYFRF